MNIAFSKIGKSIKFGKIGSSMGGDCEAPLLIRLLANNNPDKKFYIVGRSNYSKLSANERLELFPYSNVVDCYEKKMTDPANHLNEVLKNIKIDVHVAMVGQVGQVTIPNKIYQIRDPSKITSIIEMTMGYSTPVTSWMNDNQHIPVIEIVNDPRYTLAQTRDIIGNPICSLSQYNYTYNKSTIISYENQDRIDHKISPVYAEMEKIFAYSRKINEIDVKKRTKNFIVVLNEGSPSRYKFLNEWILEKCKDVQVYGQWSEDISSKDDRFAGSIPLEDLQTKLHEYRSSFCIPIAPGWVTSKYIELISAGIVPFLHPSYDTQNSLGFPEFCRPKTPQELFERVEKLSSDEFYEKLIMALRRKYLTQDVLDGTRLNGIIMKAFDSNYIMPDLNKYTIKQKEPEGLDAFFD